MAATKEEIDALADLHAQQERERFVLLAEQANAREKIDARHKTEAAALRAKLRPLEPRSSPELAPDVPRAGAHQAPAGTRNTRKGDGGGRAA